MSARFFTKKNKNKRKLILCTSRTVAVVQYLSIQLYTTRKYLCMFAKTRFALGGTMVHAWCFTYILSRWVTIAAEVDPSP